MLAGSVGMFTLALVSKASVMVLPAALVVLDIYPLRRLGGSREGWIGPAARAVWLEKIPFAILGVGGAIVTYYAQKVNLFITPLERYPLSARPAMVFYSLWFYLGKTAVPQGLSPLYELPAKVHLFDRQFLVPAIAVTFITVAVLALRRRWPAGLAVWAYYAIALGPVIGIVHSGHQLTNDRYSYLPALGFALLVGAAAGAAVQLAAAGTIRPALAKAVAALGIVWFCGLAYLSAQQVQIWRDTETLWRHSLESDPSCAICHGNLGVFFSNLGQLELARNEFERVQALRPDQVKVHQHLGYTYAMLGDYKRALGHFEIFFARYPNDVEGLNNYSAALLNGGRPTEAISHLERAITIKPTHVLSYVNLGFAYADLGRPSEALTTFRKAVALQYDAPQAWFGITRVYFESGQTRAAHTAWGILGQIDKKFANRIGPAFLQTW
jgi:tetratricopeptide (TPR) repeat protein